MTVLVFLDSVAVGTYNCASSADSSQPPPRSQWKPPSASKKPTLESSPSPLPSSATSGSSALTHGLHAGEGCHIDEGEVRSVAARVLPLLPHTSATITCCKTGFNTQLQGGPTCGLVALSIASQQLRNQVSVDDLLTRARDLGCTLHGEMFSANYLALLAEEMLERDATVLTLHQDKAKETLIQQVCRKQAAVLIAYDSDKNNAPCKANGTKAHWALLTGISVEHNLGYIFNNRLDLQPDMTSQRLFYSKSPLTSPASKSDQLFVIAAHGKSKHLQIWPLDKLIESNAQLTKVGDKIEQCDFIIPWFGMELANRCVVISKKK